MFQAAETGTLSVPVVFGTAAGVYALYWLMNRGPQRNLNGMNEMAGVRTCARYGRNRKGHRTCRRYR